MYILYYMQVKNASKKLKFYFSADSFQKIET